MKHTAQAHDHGQHTEGQHGSGARNYWLFAVNMVLSFIPMYLAMFTMIDGWRDYRNNVNMFYMALTMLAPMGIIMLVTMGSMYRNRALNVLLYVGLAALLLGSLWATRAQALVDDKQFVESMIPHHSGAILMCREANLTDADLVKLCTEIVKAQRTEISQMEAIGSRLRGKK